MVEALVISQGTIVAVAKRGQMNDLFKKYPSADKFDGMGRLVVPGLIDSHAHLTHLGHSLMEVDLRGCASLKQVRERLTDFVESKRYKSGTLVGRNWNQEQFTDLTRGEFPTMYDLETDVLKDIPILLYRVDVHAAWINQKALNTLRLPGKDVAGGAIIRDESNKPTGVFVDKAMDLLDSLVPKYDQETELAAIHLATKHMLSVGLTGLHDAATKLDTIKLLKKTIAEKKDFPIRIYAMVSCDGYCGDVIVKEDGEFLTVNAVKLFLDGAVGSWGAKMHQPYADKNTTGLLLMEPEKLKHLVAKYLDNDFQIGIHAIGDAANTLALDTYEEAIEKWNAQHQDVLFFGGEKVILGKKIKRGQDLRLRIEHAQFVQPKDVSRFAELGIIPIVQPTHATSDMNIIESRLGERAEYAYPWKSFLDAGALLPLGSDFPVESANPLYGIYSAITRLDHPGNSPHGKKGWFADECITIQQALKGFTKDAAYAAFQEDKLGSLAVGKRADFVMFDEDWMEDPRKLLTAKVLATVVDGKIRYGSL